MRLRPTGFDRQRARLAEPLIRTFPRPNVHVMFFHARRGHPLFLPLRRRSHRMPALHAEGRLSPRPARREIRRGNPDVGAPRPSRWRLRYLAHAPSRSAALRRLLHRPRVSCPASGSADGRRAAPPPRQRERLAARRPEEERLSLLPNSAISIPRRVCRASWTWSAFSHADVRRRCVTAHNRTDKKPASLWKGRRALFV